MMDPLEYPTPPEPGQVPPIADDRVGKVLGNIARDLQFQATRYRWFGAYWWLVKPMLRRAGYLPNLPWLGDFMDREALATLPPGLSAGEVLALGLGHYQFAARLAPTSEWADAPNGDRIRIYDPDVEQ